MRRTFHSYALSIFVLVKFILHLNYKVERDSRIALRIRLFTFCALLLPYSSRRIYVVVPPIALIILLIFRIALFPKLLAILSFIREIILRTRTARSTLSPSLPASLSPSLFLIARFAFGTLRIVRRKNGEETLSQNRKKGPSRAEMHVRRRHRGEGEREGIVESIDCARYETSSMPTIVV